MTQQIRSLRGPGTLDPRDVLTGPVRMIARWHLAPDEKLCVGGESTEATLFTLAGEGIAESEGVQVALAPGTSVTLPLGSTATVLAGKPSLELLGVLLDVPAEAPA